MSSYHDIVEHRDILYKLSKGIDPTTDRTFDADTILNNPILRKAFKDSAEILNDYKKMIEKPVPRKKSFFISSDNAASLYIAEESITISHLVHLINEQVQNQDMKNLKATDVTWWLMENEYLKLEHNDNGDYWKVPTKKGCDIGIKKVVRINAKGHTYSANLYDTSAQRFIADNLPIITKHS